MNGTQIGDCGNDFTVTGTLVGTDGTSYTIPIDKNDFFQTTGQTIPQGIAREAQNYTFTVSVTADNAQTVESHQAMTASTGFVNVLSDTEVSHFRPGEPACNVYVKNVNFEGYQEETDWTGPMLATYSGQVTAEQACDNVVAEIRLKGEDDSNYLNKTSIQLTKVDMYTYNFTQVIAGPNDYGYYFGKVQAYDAENEADKDYGQTSNELWDPPCYLEINKFSPTKQVTSVDGLRTQITYNIAVSEHGDNACRDNHLKVQMSDADGTTF